MTNYALLIGIKYEHTGKRLKGTLNDVKSMVKLLTSWGYASHNITVVSEDTEKKPTAYNINSSLNRFVNSLSDGDVAVIFYSGHGMIYKNKEGFNESSIVPLDYKKAGVITSESIRYYLNKIPKNVNVLCIFDACNSGTICNLKYHIFDTSYKKDVSKKMTTYNTNEWIKRQIKNVGLGSVILETEANIVTLSGCWDDQASYDLITNGALTLSLLNVIKFYQIENITFETLLQYLRGNIMFLRLKQTPQVTYGRKINLGMNLREFLKL